MQFLDIEECEALKARIKELEAALGKIAGDMACEYSEDTIRMIARDALQEKGEKETKYDFEEEESNPWLIP